MKKKKRKTRSAVRLGVTVSAVLILLTVRGMYGDSGRMAEAGGRNMISEQPVEFSMLYAGEFNPDFKCLERMRALTNVSLKVQAVSDSEYAQKAQLLINTGEIPDIMSMTVPTAEQCLSGRLLPISDYFEQMPNYMAFIEENNLQYLLEDARQADGKIYQLPVNTKEVKTADRQIMIRADVFQKNHLKVPETYEELFESCSALKKQYPDVYPMSVIYGAGNLFDTMAASFGTSGGWSSGRNRFHYLENEKRWIYAPVSEEYKEMLEYLNRCYREGLLNQEWPQTAPEQYVYDASEGNSFVLLGEWVGEEIQYETALREKDPDADWMPVFPLKGPDGAARTIRVNNATQALVISAAVKDKEYFQAFIHWLDWMYSEEGADLWSWGIEGETYTVDASGKKHFMAHVSLPVNPEGTEDISDTYGVRNNNFTFVYPYDEETARLPEEYRKLMQREVDSGAIPGTEPSIVLSEEDAKKESRYAEPLNRYVDQMTEKFIMGSESFDFWESYVKNCEARGAAVLEQMYNADQNR